MLRCCLKLLNVGRKQEHLPSPESSLCPQARGKAPVMSCHQGAGTTMAISTVPAYLSPAGLHLPQGSRDLACLVYIILQDLAEPVS